MSDSSPAVPPDVAPAPDAPEAPVAAGPVPWPQARRLWSAWAEIRADLRAALALVGALVLAGVPAGLIWWWLAPRADFRITADGPVPVGVPSSELLVADDAIFALVLAGLGLVAGIIGWRLRRRRGLATLLAVALGTAAAGVVAWRLGMLLAPAPTKAELTQVGGLVTTGLSLGALTALAVGPFVAVLAYLLPAAYSASDDLGRDEPETDVPAPPPPSAEVEPAPESVATPQG